MNVIAGKLNLKGNYYSKIKLGARFKHYPNMKKGKPRSTELKDQHKTMKYNLRLSFLCYYEEN